MSLWGPALDAEVEYRAERARRAWGGRRTKQPKDRRAARGATARRATQIRRGLWGMRPAAHHGRLA